MKTTHTLRLNDPQDRLGQAVAARLLEGAESLPSDISERLKAARMLALSKRKTVATVQHATGVATHGATAALHMGSSEGNLWNRIASLLPLLALIAGLIAIAAHHDEKRAHDLAEVDVELLADELPPSAYTDPGFAQFLSLQRRSDNNTNN